MKKQIITGIGIIACVALCANLWPRSAGVEELPAEPKKVAVSAGFEARAEETPQILFSADAPAPIVEAVAESESPKTEITAEEKTVKPAPEKPAPTQTAQPVKPAASTEPHNGDVRVVDGEKQIYLLGFGWLKDEGENIGTTVGNPGDELTGHKVGIMGNGTVGSDGDINKQIGIMGADDSAPSSTSPPAYAEPEITGDVIYTELQPPVTKDSTPPAYKPNGEPYTP